MGDRVSRRLVIGLAALAFALFSLTLFQGPADRSPLTGYSTHVAEHEKVLLLEEACDSATSPCTIPIEEHFPLMSIKVSGTLTGQGAVRVIATDGEHEWVVYEGSSDEGSTLTGMVAGDHSNTSEQAPNASSAPAPSVEPPGTDEKPAPTAPLDDVNGTSNATNGTAPALIPDTSTNASLNRSGQEEAPVTQMNTTNDTSTASPASAEDEAPSVNVSLNTSEDANATAAPPIIEEQNITNSSAVNSSSVTNNTGEPLGDTGLPGNSTRINRSETEPEPQEPAPLAVKNVRDQCVESCSLPGAEGVTLRVAVEGQARFALEEVSYVVRELVVQDADVPDLSLLTGGSADLVVTDYFPGASGLFIDVPEVKGLRSSIQRDTITVQAQRPGTFSYYFYVTDGETLLKSNTFTITVNAAEQLPEEGLTQESAEVGKPVRWTRVVRAAPGPVEVELPSAAMNVSARARMNGTLERVETSGGRMVLHAPGASHYVVTYETPAPVKEERVLSPSRKRVSISSKMHYVEVLATAELPSPAPRKGITLRWDNEALVVPEENITYLDDDADGLVERISWRVPHLSNQTFTIDITVLNPVEYLRDGDTWTVRFTTLGTADLEVSSTNAYFEELPQDDPSTEDELSFLDITCEGVSLTDRLLVNDKAYGSFTGKPGSFLVPDYSCDGEGTFEVRVNIAGYATLRLDFSSFNETVTDYAYDPEIGSCQDISSSGYYSLNQSISASGTCINVLVDNVTIDGQGYWINYSTGGDTGSGIVVNGYDNVTITNITFYEDASSGSGPAVYLDSCNDVVINQSNFSAYADKALIIDTCNNVSVLDNLFVIDSSNWDGEETISLTSSLDVNFSGNNLSNVHMAPFSFSSIGDYSRIHIDTSNTEDDLPIHYSGAATGTILSDTDVSSTYGHVICGGCTDALYDNVTLGGDGFLIAEGDNVTLDSVKVSATGADAVRFLGTTDATVRYSSLNTTAENGDGIYAESVSGHHYYNNTLQPLNTDYRIGIYVYSSSAMTIENNTVIDAHTAYRLESVTSSVLRNNFGNASGSFDRAFYVWSSDNNNFSGNTIIGYGASSNEGVYLRGSSYNQFFNETYSQTNSDAGSTPCLRMASTSLSNTFYGFSCDATNDDDIVASGTLNGTRVYNSSAVDRSQVLVDASALGGISFYEYVDVNVTNASADMVSGANVTAKDYSSTLRDSLLTDGVGLTRLSVITYLMNATHNSSYNNYTFNASLVGFATTAQEINVTDSSSYTGSGSLNFTLTVVNEPYISSVNILPSLANSSVDLRGYCTGVDLQGQALRYYYRWYVDGALDSSGSTGYYSEGVERNVHNLSSSSTAVGDSWVFSCRASDGSYNSTWVNSSSVTIVPVTPVVSDAVLNSSSGTNTTDENLTVHYSSQSAETIITDWRVDGSSLALINAPFDRNVSSSSSGAVKDYSTNAENGTLGGGSSSRAPAWTDGSSCMVGGCYNFSGVDDFVLFPAVHSGTIDSASFTWSFWFNRRSAAQYETLMQQDAFMYQLFFDASGNIDGWHGGSGGAEKLIDFNCAISNDVWYHLSLIKDGTDHQLIVRNDTAVVCNTTLTRSTTGSFTGSGLYVGHNNFSGSGVYFDGFIDEVLVFGHALSEAQDEAIYEAGLAGTQPETLVAAETDNQEVWRVSLTPVNGSVEGSSVLSNNLTVDVLPPSVSSVVLNSTYGTNTTSENLSVYYSSSSVDAVSVDWRIDGTSWAVLNMPFDRNVSSLSAHAVADYSTYANNGSLGGGSSSNAPVWNDSCVVGGCYYFTTDDYVEVPDNDSLDLTENGTIMLWVKGSSTSQEDYANLVYKASGGTAATVAFGLQWREVSGLNEIRGSVSDGSNFFSTWMPEPVDTGWHHIVYTWNYTNKSLYMDGELKNSSAQSVSAQSIGAVVKIGGDSYSTASTTDDFEGYLDEVYIFPRQLSPEQVNASYQAGLAGHGTETILSQETEVGETWSASLTPLRSDATGEAVSAAGVSIIGATPLVACQNITSSGSYSLTQDVSSSGTCFDIQVDDVVLDCLGHRITYSVAGAADTYGVYADQFNVTVRDCDILDGNWTSSNTGRNGIELYGGDNSSIIGNTVNVSNGDAISISYTAWYNNVSDNFAYSGSGSSLLTHINNRYSHFTDNVFSCSIEGCAGATLAGTWLVFSRNNVSGSGGLYTSSDNSTFTDNNISSFGNHGRAFSLNGASDNDISGNTMAATGTGQAAGMALLWSSSRNDIRDNVGSSANYAAFQFYDGSSNNVLVNNTFSSGVSTAALTVSLNSDNNSVSNSTFTSSNNGFLVESSYGNNFSGCNVSGTIGYNIQDANATFVRDCAYTSGTSFDVQIEGLSVDNVFLNCSYTTESVDAQSVLVRKWYVEGNVSNTSGSPLSAANISVRNVSGTLVGSALTDANGDIDALEVVEYRNVGGTSTYDNNITVAASKTGYYSSTSSYNLTVEGNVFAEFSLDDYTAVTACQNLSGPGPYVLTQDVTSSSGACFNVTGDDVLLDCDGHSVTYTGAEAEGAHGIYSDRLRSTVGHCSIYNFTAGVYLDDADNATLSDINVSTYSNQTIAAVSDPIITPRAPGVLLLSADYASLDAINAYSYYGRGIYLSGSTHNTIVESNGSSEKGPGVHVSWPSGSTAAYNVINDTYAGSNESYGLLFYYGSYNNASNVTGSSVALSGIASMYSSHNIIIGSRGTSVDERGIYFISSAYSTLNSSTGVTLEGGYEDGGVRVEYQCEHLTLSGVNGTSYGDSSSAGISIKFDQSNVTATNVRAVARDGYGMLVGGADILVQDSYMESNSTWALRVQSGDGVTVEDSSVLSNTSDGVIIYLGGNNMLRRLNVTGGDDGYFLWDTSNNTIRDCVAVTAPNQHAKLSVSSYPPVNNVFLNCSYERESVTATGELLRQWYVDANVTNSTGAPLSGVNVSVRNVSGSLVGSALTDANGDIGALPVTEYRHAGGAVTYANNVTVTATATDHENDTSSHNLTSEHNVFTMLSLEPHLDISSCQNVSSSGMYYLRANLSSSSGACINVTADDVVLDCDGYSITYTGAEAEEAHGIYTDRLRTAVRHCSIRNFTIGLFYDNADYGSVSDVNITTYSNQTISYVSDSVITPRAPGVLFYYTDHSNLSDVDSYSHYGRGIYLHTSTYNDLLRCNGTSETDPGIQIRRGAGNTPSYNEVNDSYASSNSSFGFYLYYGGGNTLVNVTGTSVASSGIASVYSVGNYIINSTGTSEEERGIFIHGDVNYINGSTGITQQGGWSDAGIRVEYHADGTIIEDSTGISYGTGSSGGIIIGSDVDNASVINSIGISYYDGYGIVAGGDENEIINSRAESNTSTGLMLDNPRLMTFTNVTVVAEDADAIYYQGGGYNNTFRGLNATGSRWGILIDDSDNNTFYDCVNLDGGVYDVNIISSSLGNEFVNCSYGNETVQANSELIRKWYFDGNVSYFGGGAAAGAVVSVYNLSGSSEGSAVADSSGDISPIEVTEYVNLGGTVTYATPHNGTATADGYAQNSSLYNVSSLHNVFATFVLGSDNNAPVIAFIPPTPDNDSSVSDPSQTIAATITDDSFRPTSAILDFDASQAGYWSMDYYNASGIFDNSSSGQFASFSGGLSSSNITDGARGEGLVFDGVDDELALPSGLGLQAVNFTISFWVKTLQNGSQDYIIRNTLNGNGYRFGLDHGDIAFLVGDTGGYTEDVCAGSDKANDGSWHLVTGVFVRGDAVYCYIDGVLQDSISISSYPSMSDAAPTISSTISPFDGTVDEVLVYSRPLAHEEILGLYDATTNGFNATFSYLEQGEHNYTLHAVDEAGNRVESAERNFTILDSDPPTFTHIPTNNSQAGLLTQFSVLVDDVVALQPGGQYVFSTNNSGSWVNDSAVSFTTTPEAVSVSKTLLSSDTLYRWYLTDNLGNSVKTPIYDVAAPTVTVNAPSGTISDITPLLNVSSSEIGSIWYNVDSGANSTLCSSCNESADTYLYLAEGSHTLYVYANDSLGNVGSAEQSFIVDLGFQYHDNYDDSSDIATLDSVTWAAGNVSITVGFDYRSSPDLVSIYDFDDASGLGDDATGTNNMTVTYSDPAQSSTVPPLKSGYSVDLDGDDVLCTVAGSDTFASDQDHTLCWWSRPATLVSNANHFAQTCGYDTWSSSGGTTYRWRINNCNGGTASDLDVADVWSIGEWVHVCNTYNASSYNRTVYINGSLNTSQVDASPIVDVDAEWCIGGCGDYCYAEGLIYQPMWFDAILGDEEIESIYRGSGGDKGSFRSKAINTSKDISSVANVTWSESGTGNDDNVTVEISVDGGTTWYQATNGSGLGQDFGPGNDSLVYRVNFSGATFMGVIAVLDINISWNEAPLVVVNNTYVNSTTAHAFTVTAGVSDGNGAGDIVSTSIDDGSCAYSSNSTSGIYFNVTYVCSGTPFTQERLSITFCDSDAQCVSTPSSNNSYPNQAPATPVLVVPAADNYSVRTRTPFFNWTIPADPEGDSLTYDLNVTNVVAPDYTASALANNNHTAAQELWTEYETGPGTNPYSWSVRACDQWNCSSWSSTRSFSIDDYLSVVVTNNVVDFGSGLELNIVNDTADGVPQPFLFRNDGLIRANLTNVSATLGGLWDAVSLGTSYFQFKANRSSSEPESFDLAGSVTSWQNVSVMTSNQTIIGSLNFSDAADEAAIDIRIQVPGAETPGEKQETLQFEWGSAS